MKRGRYYGLVELLRNRISGALNRVISVIRCSFVGKHP